MRIVGHLSKQKYSEWRVRSAQPNHNWRNCSRSFLDQQSSEPRLRFTRKNDGRNRKLAKAQYRPDYFPISFLFRHRFAIGLGGDMVNIVAVPTVLKAQSRSLERIKKVIETLYPCPFLPSVGCIVSEKIFTTLCPCTDKRQRSTSCREQGSSFFSNIIFSLFLQKSRSVTEGVTCSTAFVLGNESAWTRVF